MINVNGIKRNAKNIVKKYSDAQVKVREATSNDPWGPSSTIMAEIADLTYNVVAFSEIMQMIWKRLNDHGKNWRHVYKALVLLEYLVKTGTEKVAQQCIENIFAIQTLKDFQYMEENKDYGLNIREKSKRLVSLLKDSQTLKAERARALKAKARSSEAMSSDNHSGIHYETGASASNTSQERAGPASAISEIDSARPSSLNEEEQQLRIALALSKEEAEQQERTRQNDELRLKLALDVSKNSTSSTSNNGPSLIDDFNEPPAPAPAPAPVPAPALAPAPAPASTSQIIVDLFEPTQSDPLASLFREPQNDPWSSDPWQAAKKPNTISKNPFAD